MERGFKKLGDGRKRATEKEFTLTLHTVDIKNSEMPLKA